MSSTPQRKKLPSPRPSRLHLQSTLPSPTLLRVTLHADASHVDESEDYLEINGAWEDHVRFAITAEDWAERGEQLTADWIGF